MEKLLDCNWTSLKLFLVSKICYRPLQQPIKERVIQKLHIFLDESDLHFECANFLFRLNNCDEWESKTYERDLDVNSTQKKMRSLPINGLPQDILAIERVCLQLCKQNESVSNQNISNDINNNLHKSNTGVVNRL